MGEGQELEADTLTFWQHASVLRSYVLWGASIYVLIAGLIFTYAARTIVTYLIEPLRGQQLVFLSPLGPFFFYLNVSLIGAAVLSLPFWIYLFSRFAGGKMSIRRHISVLLYTGTTAMLGLASVAIAYFYFIPVSLKALATFSVPGIALLITAENYINFFILGTLVIFVVLELPVLVVGLSSLRLVNPHYLSKKRRVVFVVLLIALALLTPTTDPITLLIVTIPAMAFFEVGLFVAKMVYTNSYGKNT
jgi:sec-independent protein translocase protein TatC